MRVHAARSRKDVPDYDSLAFGAPQRPGSVLAIPGGSKGAGRLARVTAELLPGFLSI